MAYVFGAWVILAISTGTLQAFLVAVMGVILLWLGFVLQGRMNAGKALYRKLQAAERYLNG